MSTPSQTPSPCSNPAPSRWLSGFPAASGGCISPRKPLKPAASPSGSKLPLHTLLAVTWEDAAFDLDKDPGTLLMTTVGYLIKNTASMIVLAGEAGPGMDYFRSYTAIPTSIIRKTQVLAPV